MAACEACKCRDIKLRSCEHSAAQAQRITYLLSLTAPSKAKLDEIALGQRSAAHAARSVRHTSDNLRVYLPDDMLLPSAAYDEDTSVSLPYINSTHESVLTMAKRNGFRISRQRKACHKVRQVWLKSDEFTRQVGNAVMRLHLT